MTAPSNAIGARCCWQHLVPGRCGENPAGAALSLLFEGRLRRRMRLVRERWNRNVRFFVGMKWERLTVLLSIALSTMLLVPSLGLLRAAALLPLAPGKSWTYRAGAGGSMLQVSVGETTLTWNDRIYFELKGYAGQSLWVRLGANGVFAASGRMCPSEGEVQEKRFSTKAPPGNGAFWRSATGHCCAPMQANFPNSSRKTSAWSAGW